MSVETSRTLKQTSAQLWRAFLLVMLAGAGCSVEPADKPAATASNPSLYGPPLGTPSISIPRLRPMEDQAQQWASATFACVETELSPATLYHSTTKDLGCFTHLADYGLGAPAYAAFNTPTGPTIHKNGQPMDAKWMEENWVLVWFEGAAGWTNWDSPWVVYLQHKPTAITLDAGGLHFEFKQAAGDVVLFPLYGYDKASPMGKDFLTAHGLPSKKIQTREWTRAIPRDPLMRVKYWACATREFPIYCEESFSVNRAKDTVTIRQRFQWHSIQDDWNTRHIKVAPISPSLALASMDPSFPLEFSKPVRDFAFATRYGPYHAAENVDSFDATFKVLQYINETEASDPPQTTNHPTVPVAIDRLRATARGQFSRSEKYDDDDALWYAKALPYYDEATRTNALTSLRAYFHDNRKAEFNLESLWAYAHFSGDWELVKQNWELVKKQFRAPADTHWAGSGPDSARFNDSTPNLTAPCLALARLAYKIGDMDTYNYASYRFARELTRASADERGATYLRHHQPWDSMKFTDEPTGPTNSDRWTRFNNEDVGRFYRDHLKEDGRRELALLLQKSEPKRKHNDDPHLLPSEIRLRSLLLNETPAQLAAVATPDQFSGPPSGVIASCLSVLRTSHPTRYERLIPAGEPSPFVAGLEREVAGPNPYLIQAIQSTVQDQINQTGRPIWPEVTWGQSWKTPTGHKWTFGHVTPVREETPTNVQTVPLNWNTEAFTYGLKLL